MLRLSVGRLVGGRNNKNTTTTPCKFFELQAGWIDARQSVERNDEQQTNKTETQSPLIGQPTIEPPTEPPTIGVFDKMVHSKKQQQQTENRKGSRSEHEQKQHVCSPL
jgi:hypothetical protein